MSGNEKVLDYHTIGICGVYAFHWKNEGGKNWSVEMIMGELLSYKYSLLIITGKISSIKDSMRLIKSPKGMLQKSEKK